MIQKIVYETQWSPVDKNKEYPHGYGFMPILVEFPQDADVVECANACKKLSNEEFTCYGAVPRAMIDGSCINGINPFKFGYHNFVFVSNAIIKPMHENVDISLVPHTHKEDDTTRTYFHDINGKSFVFVFVKDEASVKDKLLDPYLSDVFSIENGILKTGMPLSSFRQNLISRLQHQIELSVNEQEVIENLEKIREDIEYETQIKSKVQNFITGLLPINSNFSLVKVFTKALYEYNENFYNNK